MEGPLARLAHQQVFGALVHREHDALADVGGIGQQHPQPVDARGTAAMQLLSWVLRVGEGVLPPALQNSGNRPSP